MLGYLHSMIRVRDVDATLRFFCDGLGLREMRRQESEQGKFTLVSHITGFLGYRDGRSRHDGVDWFQKAEGYRQAQQQLDGGQ